MATLDDTLFQECNKVRTLNRKPTLTRNTRLEQAAQELADHVAKVNRLSHWQMEQRVKRGGYRYSSIAENAAYSTTPEGAVNQWMRSSGHKKNLMGNYKDVGCGVARMRNGQFVFVVTFGTPA
jgi:uncharacterized protein YkwD